MASIRKDESGNVYLSNPWYVWDVINAANDMGITITTSEAEDILCAVANSHDPNIGINWDVFYYHIQQLCDQETQEREDNA